MTPFGRDVIAECQRLGVLVDLAHMSEAGIRDALPLLRPPFVLSHTGFTALAGQRSRVAALLPADAQPPLGSWHATWPRQAA